MAEKKLFHVSATLDIDMVILAESEEQAVAIGKKNWHEEMSDAGLEPDHYSAYEVTRRKQVAWLGENLEYTTPYGPENEPSPQDTINECLDKLGVK